MTNATAKNTTDVLKLVGKNKSSNSVKYLSGSEVLSPMIKSAASKTDALITLSTQLLESSSFYERKKIISEITLVLNTLYSFYDPITNYMSLLRTELKYLKDSKKIRDINIVSGQEKALVYAANFTKEIESLRTLVKTYSDALVAGKTPNMELLDKLLEQSIDMKGMFKTLESLQKKISALYS
jgi:hypothetical protein